MKLNENKGIAFLMLLVSLSVTVMGFASLSNLVFSQLRSSNKILDNTKAFYLAEASAAYAVGQLRGNFDVEDLGTANTTLALGDGEYYYDIDAEDGNGHRKIRAYAAVPNFENPDIQSRIDLIVQSPEFELPDIFDKAIYSEQDILVNGKSHEVNGDVFSGNDINCYEEGVEMCAGMPDDVEELLDSAYTMPALDLEALKVIAQNQVYDGHDNYFTQEEIDNGDPPLPTDFYLVDPIDASDPGTPHVVFIEGNLVLGGNKGNAGGFVIVVGDVLENPSTGSGSVTMNGNTHIEGVVYVHGEFNKNGGGNQVNVNGGVIARDVYALNGSVAIDFVEEYHNSITSGGLQSADIEVLSWNARSQEDSYYPT